MASTTQDSRVVLVTGASSGIGKCCAERLAGAGWRVFGASRSAPAAERYDVLRMDIADDEAVEKGVAHILATCGRIDAIVNNAAVNLRGSVEDVPMAEGREIMEINYFGTLRVCRAALPALRARKGSIINIGSFAGSIGTQFGGHYAASKYAVQGVTESLRRELAPFGVRVTNISPGFFRTGMSENIVVSDSMQDGAYAERFNRFMKNADKFMKNMTTPEPVAALVQEILESHNPKGYYFIGPAYQRAVLLAKRLLPQTAFEAIMDRVLE